MRIVGFDPGIKNTGICVLDDDATTSIGTIDVTDFVTGIQCMDTYLANADLIAIEAQPGTNRAVTKVMHFIELYARLKSTATIVFIAPRTRLAFVRRYTDLETTTYKERKLASVRVARFLMTDATKFDELDKKDDAAEAFLCAYIAKQNVAE